MATHESRDSTNSEMKEIAEKPADRIPGVHREGTGLGTLRAVSVQSWLPD